MTTAYQASSDVDVLDQDDVTEAVQRTLSALHLTFPQLAEQARKRHFESIEARLAWLAIGELYKD